MRIKAGETPGWEDAVVTLNGVLLRNAVEVDDEEGWVVQFTIGPDGHYLLDEKLKFVFERVENLTGLKIRMLPPASADWVDCVPRNDVPCPHGYLHAHQIWAGTQADGAARLARRKARSALEDQ